LFVEEPWGVGGGMKWCVKVKRTWG